VTDLGGDASVVQAGEEDGCSSFETHVAGQHVLHPER
jgi:hypothetical protein